MLQTAEDIRLLNEKINHSATFIDKIHAEIGKVIVGQNHMVERLLIGLLSNGHILLEGVPGLAKTLSIKSLASTINAHFSRIQFTPDLLPADVIGTMIYNQQKNEFVVRKGPIFATFILDEPFLVLATQNPIEQEGTYPLPEAQVDRFMLKVVIDYPSKAEEQAIIRQNVLGLKQPFINAVVSSSEILNARQLVREVYMDEKVEQYIIDIVFASRYPEQYNLPKIKPLISYGGSPRASINLALASKTYAYLNKRGYVIPEDVRNICKDVLRHRIGLTYEAEAEHVNVEMIINEILKAVNVP